MSPHFVRPGRLPDAWLLSGLVCDTATGVVEVVVPPGPSRVAST